MQDNPDYVFPDNGDILTGSHDDSLDPTLRSFPNVCLFFPPRDTLKFFVPRLNVKIVERVTQQLVKFRLPQAVNLGS